MAMHSTTKMISLRPHRGVLALLATLALAATAAAPAATAAPAANVATFALTPVGTPGAVLLRGMPRSVLRGAVSVRNTTRHPVTVILRRADITTASNGNADYVTSPLSSAGRWLHLVATSVDLPPRAVRQVAFTVSIPAGTEGASHYAGIVAIDAAQLAAAAHPTPNGHSFAFSYVNREALPLTIRLPGPLYRSLKLRSLAVDVEPAGAGLVLGLLPGGSDLIEGAQVHLRVLRGARVILTDASTLGQLFPGTGLNFRIPWVGQPTRGSYRVVGVIRPERAAPIYINQTIQFTPAKLRQLQRVTPAASPAPAAPSTVPLWAWVALTMAGILLAALLFAMAKLRRRTAELAA
jgi:hypothetical protein